MKKHRDDLLRRCLECERMLPITNFLPTKPG